MTRVATHEHYDAAVGVFPFHGQPAAFGFGLAKLTHEVGADGALRLTSPEPLAHDIRERDAPFILRPGNDFWPQKSATDVIVTGSAYSTYPVRRMMVSVCVGQACKRVEVFGRRFVRWVHGRPRIGEPEPFVEMPVTAAHAYGGVDGRVPVETGSLHDRMAAEWDHPGVYPRNPFGKGYLVRPEPVEGVELPNLENPDDRLSADRIIVGDPRAWHRQPLPWTLDHLHPMMFPRYVHLGADAWFPVPSGEVPAEVRHGWLAPDYRARCGQGLAGLVDGVPSELFQEASLGMVFAKLPPGTPIGVRGMHPQGRRLEFAVPAPPRMDFELEGHLQAVRPRLVTILIRPAEARVCLTYVGILEDLRRTFIPGVHGRIPLTLRVARGRPIRYEAPPTVRSRLMQSGR